VHEVLGGNRIGLPMSVFVATVVVLCAAPLVLAGCGGSSRAAPTKAEFLQKSSAICRDMGAKLETAGREFFGGAKGASRTEADFVKEKVDPILRAGLDSIEALGAPEGDESTITALLDAGRAGLAKVDDNPELIKADPGSAKDPLREFGRVTQAYGISCAAG
jgi:hypothetical protein